MTEPLAPGPRPAWLRSPAEVGFRLRRLGPHPSNPHE